MTAAHTWINKNASRAHTAPVPEEWVRLCLDDQHVAAVSLRWTRQHGDLDNEMMMMSHIRRGNTLLGQKYWDTWRVGGMAGVVYFAYMPWCRMPISEFFLILCRLCAGLSVIPPPKWEFTVLSRYRKFGAGHLFGPQETLSKFSSRLIYVGQKKTLQSTTGAIGRPTVFGLAGII